MNTFLFLGIIIAFSYLLFNLMFWIIHIIMSKSSTPYGYEVWTEKCFRISFRKFLRLYKKFDWDRVSDFPEGHFFRPSGYIWADIVIIGRVKYFFGFFGYIPLTIWKIVNRVKKENQMVWFAKNDN